MKLKLKHYGLLFLLLLSACDSTNTDPQIKFGLIKKDKNGYYVYNETTIIPNILKEDGLVYGISIKSGKKPFSYYTIMRSPKPTPTVSGTLKSIDGGYTLISDKQICDSDYCGNTIWNEQGDPIGPQTLEVYINDELVKVIDFIITETK